MLYSKLLNIQKNKLNENFNIYINKTFKFRILTQDNKKGIKFNIPNENIINESKYNGNYWYTFSESIDFSCLKKYQYIVIQLLSEKNYNEFDINTDNTYTVTHKNEWYKVTPKDPNCDLEFYSQEIESFKPIQQINENLIYKINGDAELIKNKYIKAGKEESIIYIIGLYPFMVNYRYSFTLDTIKDKSKKKILKNDKNYNKFTELSRFIDSDETDVNYRIEMLKYQLKNYFVENNLQLEEIETKLLDTQDKNEEYLKIVDKMEFQISEYDILMNEIRTRYNTFEDNLSKLNNDLSEQSETIESLLILTNDFMAIKADVRKLKEDIINAFNKYDNNKSNIEKNKIDIEKNKSEIDNILKEIKTIEENLEKLELKLSDNVNDIYDKFKIIENQMIENNQKIYQKIDTEVGILNKYNSDFSKKYNTDQNKQNTTNKDLYDKNNTLKEKTEADIKEINKNTIETNNNNNKRFMEIDKQIIKNDDNIESTNNRIDDLTITINKNNAILAENDNKIITKIGQQDVKIDVIKNKINEMILSINKSNKLNDEKNNQQDDKLSNIDDKLSIVDYKLKDLEKIIYDHKNHKGIYSNLIEYSVPHHSDNLTINFMTDDNYYSENNLYLICDDYYREKRPYYCWKVKKVNGSSSTAKLISIINSKDIYY